MSLIKSKLNSVPILKKTLRECALVGANLERQDLRGLNLRGTNFSDASLRGADLSYANLQGCNFTKADLSQAVMHLADCTSAIFQGADLSMACGRGILFNDADMSFAHLRQVFMKHCFFVRTNLQYADFAHGYFLGSCFNDANLSNVRNIETATFIIWRSKHGAPLSLVPKPDYVPTNWSDTGTLSFQENAGHRRVDL